MAGQVEVRGVVEAVESATFDYQGRPVFVRGRDHGRLGTLIRAGHPIIKGREGLFRPLVLDLDHEADR